MEHIETNVQKHSLKHIKILICIIFFLIIPAGIMFGYDILNREAAPEDMQYLDMTLTDNSFYVTDDNYTKTLNDIILPYISEYVNEGYITTADNASLHYESYILTGAGASVVISHGYTESLNKYREVIYYFLKNNYNVFIMDHRGHGLSTRETDDNWMVTIDDYSTYLADFKEFMDQIVVPESSGLDILLFAHSMGGAIGTYFLEEYPGYFSAAVLSSPMLEINPGNYPSLLAWSIARIHKFLGMGNRYIWGQGPYMGEYDFSGSSTATQGRYDYFHSLNETHPDTQTNGGSFNWLNASFKILKQITSTENASKVDIPVLLFQAENDSLVLPYGHYRFAKAAQDTTLIYVENSKHEIFNSPAEIMIPYYNTVFDFFDKTLEN